MKIAAADSGRGPAEPRDPGLFDLEATGGRYEALRSWAERHGCTEKEALRRWLGLRAAKATRGHEDGH